MIVVRQFIWKISKLARFGIFALFEAYPTPVMPAQAGIHIYKTVDSRFHANDRRSAKVMLASRFDDK